MTFKVLKYALGLLLVCQLAPQCFAQQNSILVRFDTFSCIGAAMADFPNFSAASSLALGGSNPGIVFGTGGASAGKTTFDDTKVVKTLDDCTPQLFKSLANGSNLATVTILILTPATATAPATQLLSVVMQNVVITSDEFAEAVGGKPSEVVTLDWTKITITHVPSGATFTWNKETNSAT